MNFKEKFEKMVDLAEENIGKEISEIDKIVGREFGINGRAANQAFSFITSIGFADYIRRRKLTKIIEKMKQPSDSEQENKLGSIENPAWSEYGYSEKSAFDRAFKRDFNVTPADVVNNVCHFDGVSKLSFETIMENGMEFESQNKRIDEETTAAVVEQLVSNGSMIINLESADDKQLLNEIMECQALYELSTDQVLLAYELSEDKSFKGLSRACEAISFVKENLKEDKINDDLKDILYLVVNNNLYIEEAEKIVEDIRNGSNIDVRRIDKTYLDIVVKYNYEYGAILENLPYDTYKKIEPMISKRIVDALELDIHKEDSAQLLKEACTLLAMEFTNDELLNLTELNKKEISLMFSSLTAPVWITRAEATVVTEDLNEMNIEDWHECDEGYKGILVSTFKKRPLKYSSYCNLVKELKEFGITDKQEIDEVVRKTTEFGWDGSFDEVVENIVSYKRIEIKYELSEGDVKELMSLTNSRVSIEKACETYKSNIGKKAITPIETYGNIMTHLTEEPKDRYNELSCTLGERLALMISLNSGEEYQDVKRHLEKEFAKYNADFDFSDYLYYSSNLLAADMSEAEQFNAVAYSDFRNLVKMAESALGEDEVRGMEIVFLSVVTYACDIYESIKESFDRISELMGKVREIVPEQHPLNLDDICVMYKYTESLSKKKPHELSDEDLKKLIMCSDYDFEEKKNREYTPAEIMHMRMIADTWASAIGWKFAAPVNRELL